MDDIFINNNLGLERKYSNATSTTSSRNSGSSESFPIGDKNEKPNTPSKATRRLRKGEQAIIHKNPVFGKEKQLQTILTTRKLKHTLSRFVPKAILYRFEIKCRSYFHFILMFQQPN